MLENFNDGAFYAAFQNVANPANGLGQASDRSMYNSISPYVRILDEQEITALYRTSALIAKVIESLPNDCCEVQWEYVFDNANVDSSDIQKILDNLGLPNLIHSCLIEARLYGDSYLIVDVDDRTPLDQPISYLKAKSIIGFRPVQFYQIMPRHNPQGDLLYYQLTGVRKDGTQDIKQNLGTLHPSRVIRFVGKRLRGYALHHNGYRNDSVLQEVVSSYLNFAASMQLAINMMSDYKVFTYGLKDLALLLSPDPVTGLPKAGAVEALTLRLQTMKLNMSVNGGIAFDSETESVGWLQSSYAGVREIIETARDVFSANTKIPHTKLWDEGSQGNTSGRSEKEDWTKQMSSYLHAEHKPVMLMLANLVMSCSNYGFSNPEGVDIDIEYQELNPIDDKTKAEIRQIQASVDTSYLTAGVLSIEEVRLSRFDDAGDQMQTNLIEGSLDAQSEQLLLAQSQESEDDTEEMTAELQDAAGLSDGEFNAIAEYSEEDIKATAESWSKVKSLLPIVYADREKV